MARPGQARKKLEYQRSAAYANGTSATASGTARSKHTSISFQTPNGNDDHELFSDDNDDDEDGDEQPGESRRKGGKKPKGKGGTQVLPVAELEDDWEGVAEDGATYLALANRENSKLPAVSRVVNPYQAAASPSPEPRSIHLSGNQPQAGPSRHPALPSETWKVLFPIHFSNYRKRVHEHWPPSPPLPYPSTWPNIPSHGNRHEWMWFINGYRRQRIHNLVPIESDERQRDGGGEDGGGEDIAEGDGEGDVPMDEEEAFFNSQAPKPQKQPMRDDWVMEEESERHHPREPTVAVLQSLSTVQVISILIRITHHLTSFLDKISETLVDPASAPTASTEAPTQIDNQEQRPNPFPEHLSKWVFALLIILEPQLMADQVSYLRDLARALMRIGGWRWITAVTNGEVDQNWVMGERWAAAGRDGTKGEGVKDGNENDESAETAVDATLARCWMIIYAIGVGWAQHDLVEDLENLFK